ncbi:MAG: PAS domain S-box protein [Bryobacterales bacterium]|nr:PAS domain S-box protein [Bryobacterales bacterium]
MRQRILLAAGFLLLGLSTALVVWQGSFSMGSLRPASTNQAFLFWAVSTFVFLLTLIVGFLLFRSVVKLYFERKSSREGSRIKTKLVAGAIGLTVLPAFFLVLFSISVLNFNLDKWFSRPGEGIKEHLIAVSNAIEREIAHKAMIEAHLIASSDRIREGMRQGANLNAVLKPLCEEFGIPDAAILSRDERRLALCGQSEGLVPVTGTRSLARIEVKNGKELLGFVVVAAQVPEDLAGRDQAIVRYLREYDQLAIDRREWRAFYLQLMALLTLFILFIATWVATLLSKQISIPIATLLHAAGEVRKGNLSYRVKIPANDELAALVRGFNEMTQDLEASAHELERRRQFMETILESIPTGVISVSPEGVIQQVNSSFRQMFPHKVADRTLRLEDIFEPEDAAELRYLMNRAGRTGQASRQWEQFHEGSLRNVSVTVAAIDRKPRSGYVIVLEDTTEILRAQKVAAWHEVARRVAHEIKNPLTPIALSADRVRRRIERLSLPGDDARVIREAAETIAREVESVRTLVNEFAQFARLPGAQLRPADLNDVVEDALMVFAGRLEDVNMELHLDADLPAVPLDRNQFKRVIINLVDNAVEAMAESAVKRIVVQTHRWNGSGVQLWISDSGCGVSPEDKAKLFVPYYSTKGRGSGLGLAIVNHILEEHQASIRVEDNEPSGTTFIIEFAATASEGQPPAESPGLTAAIEANS